MRDQARSGESARSTRDGSTIIQNAPPDVTTYVRAANLFPILVESDQVKAEREARFGPAEGIVTRERDLPDLDAEPDHALGGPRHPGVRNVGEREAGDDPDSSDGDRVRQLDDEAAEGCRHPPKQRITLQTIQGPREAIASATASPMVAVIAFCGVLFAFALLAVVVDRLQHPVRVADVEPIVPRSGCGGAGSDGRERRVVGRQTAGGAKKASSTLRL